MTADIRPPFAVAPCRADQTEEYVRVHVEVMCETYAHLPAADAFVAARRSEVTARIAALGAEIAAADAALAAGRPPARRHVVGLDASGRIVAVASGGLGIEAWERHLDPPVEPPATPWCLSHLYVAAAARGTGLAAALMEAALTGAPSAYLWVYPDNPRAVTFYRRHGFVPDGTRITAGPEWGGADIVRMVRPSRPA